MIRLEHVTKTFRTKDGDVHAVKDVSLDIPKGTIYGIIGFSGAGKSTLVRCMNLLEKPDEGRVIFDGEDLMELNPAALRAARSKMGMIFQHFNLMSALTIFENIALPLRLEKAPREEIEKKVMGLLELIDLVERKDSYPSQLSGGQKQRVAIARALVNDPKVLLCDEATSALDPQTTQTILRLIRKINHDLGLTVVVITHEMMVVKEICDRVAVMEKGRVIEQGDIVPIFVHPEKQLTRDFLSTASNADKIYEMIEAGHPATRLADNQQLVRLQYGSDASTKAVISMISRAYDVDCSIISGNIEAVQSALIGTMVTVFTGTDENIRKAISALKKENVEVEVIKRGHIE